LHNHKSQGQRPWRSHGRIDPPQGS